MIYPTELFANSAIVENCTIEITDQCNFLCLHCDYPKKRDGIFMSLEVLDIIAKQLLEMGTFRITISGGEPFEHPKVVEIIEKLINMSFYVKIITNGFYITEEQIEKLSKYKKLEIVFSLLGTRETHDSITRIKGSFESIDSKVRKLKKASCKVSFQTCVLHNNYDNLKELTEYARRIEVPQKLDPFITNIINNKLIPEMRLTNVELMEYYKRFTNISSVVNKVILEQELVRLKSCDCGVAKSTITIIADGNILPCGNIRISVGNILKTPIKDIWKLAPFLQELRNRSELDRPICESCDMKTLCSRCIAMAISEHSDWKYPPEECCRHMKCLKEVSNVE